MKYVRDFVTSTLVGGVLIVLPLYLAILLLLKSIQAVSKLLQPILAWLPLPTGSSPVVALLIFLLVCFLVGAAVRTTLGRGLRERFERRVLERLPGYALIRSLTRRLAGDGDESAWEPAMIEIEDGLVPGFVIEKHGDGRFTVFVPSVPTPFAGAVYVLEAQRVHPVDVPLTAALKTVSRWGSGSAELVAAMRTVKQRA